MNLHERFWSRVVVGDSCWLWDGAHIPSGYGSIADGSNKQKGTHRVVVELLTGAPVPPEMHVDHLCRNKGCVNPDHLEVVTPRINTLRGGGPTAVNATKTHCKRGHEFTPENTYIIRDGRSCRACDKARLSRYGEKRHARLVRVAAATEACECGRVVRAGGLKLHRIRVHGVV